MLLGLSPWLTIPYSDSLALIFPTAILYIYTRNAERLLFKCLKFSAIVSLACIGYWIKPQTVIVAIAIVGIEVINHLNSLKKKTVKETLLIFLTCCICAGIFQGISVRVHTIEGFERDEDRMLDMTHFFMMGLNRSVGGTWSGEDIEFSVSQPTLEARHKANLEEGWNRLKDFGITGYIRFLAKKTITAYNDGTFAWAGEGGFWEEIYEPKNNVASPFLRSVYYSNGRNYMNWRYMAQTIWLAVLLYTFGNFFLCRKMFKKFSRKYELVIFLSLIGLTMFQLLFEVRARYLYTYVPFFIILATMGFQHMLELVDRTGLYGKNIVSYVCRKIKRQ